MEGERLITKGHRGILGSDEILHLACSTCYSMEHICQNSQSFVQKVEFNVCKLYLNKSEK